MIKTINIIILSLIISSCQSKNNSVYTSYYQENETISLQNPYSRDVVKCNAGSFFSNTVNDCITNYESKGYIKLQDKVMMSAKYDLLETNRYPERKWREKNFVPRW